MSAGLTGEKAAKGEVLINVLAGRGHSPFTQAILNDEMRVVGDQSLMLSLREGHVPFGLLDESRIQRVLEQESYTVEASLAVSGAKSVKASHDRFSCPNHLKHLP